MISPAATVVGAELYLLLSISDLEELSDGVAGKFMSGAFRGGASGAIVLQGLFLDPLCASVGFVKDVGPGLHWNL